MATVELQGNVADVGELSIVGNAIEFAVVVDGFILGTAWSVLGFNTPATATFPEMVCDAVAITSVDFKAAVGSGVEGFTRGGENVANVGVLCSMALVDTCTFCMVCPFCLYMQDLNLSRPTTRDLTLQLLH